MGLIPKGVGLIDDWIKHKRQLELAQLRLTTPETSIPSEPVNNGQPLPADSPGLCPKLDCLKVSIRPIITYSLFYFFIFCKIALLVTMISVGINTIDIHKTILDDDTLIFLSLLISFWFGTRMFKGPK